MVFLKYTAPLRDMFCAQKQQRKVYAYTGHRLYVPSFPLALVICLFCCDLIIILNTEYKKKIDGDFVCKWLLETLHYILYLT
jgi:hypothetical protein